MFGKTVSPGWDESQHSGGSLKPVIKCPPGHYLGPQQKCLPYDPTFPLPEKPEPDRYYPLTPEAVPRKVVSTFKCPPGHYLGPQQKCLPYDPAYDVKIEQKPFNFWPLLLLGIAAYFQLK